jgi:trk system potassium uptake protein TrkA
MKRQFAVIGLGTFGSEVARTLARNKYDVIAIDKDEEKVKELADSVAMAVQLDATNERALKEAGVQDVDVAIVSIGKHIESSILVVMLLKDLGIKHIIAKSISDLYGRILTQLGIDKVVHPEQDGAQRFAHSLIKPEFLEFIDLSPDYSIVELPAAEKFWNKTLGDLRVRENFGITVIAIKGPLSDKTRKNEWNINPVHSDIIKPHDVLVILGNNDNIEKFSDWSK